MTETLQVSLPADVIQALRRAVQTHEYSSSDDAITEALREWADRRVPTTGTCASDIDELRRLCDEADSGDTEFVDPEEVFARLEEKYHVETKAR